MTTSRTALRIITLLFLLAGILLLRKPVFGQPITAMPTYQRDNPVSQLIESPTVPSTSHLHRSNEGLSPCHEPLQALPR
jgi:hypothetical protein